MTFWLWIAVAAVVLIFVLAAASRIRIRLRYSRTGKLDQLVVVIQALHGLFHYQMLLPTIVIRNGSVEFSEESSGGVPGNVKNKKSHRIITRGTLRRYRQAYHILLGSTRSLRRWLLYTLKKVECTRWRLDFRVGTGDAPSTAVILGLLWTIAGCLSGALGQFMSLKTSPHSRIEPNYAQAEFSVVWEADFRIRAGTVLWAMLKLGKQTIKLRRAYRAWRNLLTGPRQA